MQLDNRIDQSSLKAMYHISVVEPQGYIHSRVFDELVSLVKFSILQMGKSCSVGTNTLVNNRTNIIVGCHLIPDGVNLDFPASSIFLNTEPLFSQNNIKWSRRVVAYAKQFRVWDYNAKNVNTLTMLGARDARLLRVGYQPELAVIPKSPSLDIDVLFYGSRNKRRLAVLQDIQARGMKVVALLGVYGKARDDLIARSKVVLNMQYFDQRNFEIIRVFYLMTNAKAVVTELGPNTLVERRFLSGLKAVPYDSLLTTCERLVADHAERQALESAALRTIMAYPQVEFMSPLLEGDRKN